MNVSKRLNRLADMVTEGNRLADVGTDHGYVPISLIKKKRIPSAIAMDINRGPLKRAQSHIKENALEAYIETRLSDGLEALRPGEADSVLIAGMGGGLTVRILKQGQHALPGVSELILQPQSEIERVRMWLEENGWKIVCEDILLDEGKYYPMMRAVPRTEEDAPEAYAPEEYRFGRLSLQMSPEVLKEFLVKRAQVQKAILSAMPEEGDQRLKERKEELREEVKILEKVGNML